MDRGTNTYTLGSFITIEMSGSTTVEVNNIEIAEIHLFEHNIDVFGASQLPAPALGVSTLVFLGSLLVLAGLRSLRRA